MPTTTSVTVSGSATFSEGLLWDAGSTRINHDVNKYAACIRYAEMKFPATVQAGGWFVVKSLPLYDTPGEAKNAAQTYINSELRMDMVDIMLKRYSE